MRLLVISNLFPPDVLGGHELLCADVVAALRARGHDVDVITTGVRRPDDPPWVHRDLTLVRPFGEPLGLARIDHARLARRHARVIASHLEARPVDAALLFSLRRLGLHVVRALAVHGVPRVAVLGDDWPLAFAPSPGRTPLRRLLGRAIEQGPLAARTWRGVTIDAGIAVSGALAGQLRAGGVPIAQLAVAAQGIDLASFAARAPRPLPAAPALLWVGRLHRSKACDVAIDAVARLHAAGVPATLTIAGTGAEAAALDAQVAAGGLGAFVRFTGQIDRAALPALYQAHDAFLFTGRGHEAAGLTHLEARASGLPVIAQPSGGAAEYLRDDVDAVIAADAAGIAAAVRALIDDPGRALRLGRDGRRAVVERASLDRFVDVVEATTRRGVDGAPPIMTAGGSR